MKFKAAILEKLNSPLVIKEVETTELQVGQVLVKISMSGLCGSQVHEITGAKGNEKFLPHMMGHEGCGFVVETGPGVTNVKVGDKVVMHWKTGKGIESDYPKYILDNKVITSGKVTTLAEYSVCSENRLTTVPKHTDDRLCCLLGCSLTTAFGVMDNDANIKLGETVLIVGAGGVGLNLIQAAKLKGAGKIYALDKNEKKKILVEKLGGNWVGDIIPYADVIIDTTGNPILFQETIERLNSGGKYILVGQGAPEISYIINDMMKLFNGEGTTIKASQGGQTNPTKDIPRYIKMYDHKMFEIDNIITDIFAFDDVNKGFDVLRSGTAGRVMIKMYE
jgi:Zn-dependent alcohol dehydrogenase